MCGHKFTLSMEANYGLYVCKVRCMCAGSFLPHAAAGNGLKLFDKMQRHDGQWKEQNPYLCKNILKGSYIKYSDHFIAIFCLNTSNVILKWLLSYSKTTFIS